MCEREREYRQTERNEINSKFCGEGELCEKRHTPLVPDIVFFVNLQSEQRNKRKNLWSY